MTPAPSLRGLCQFGTSPLTCREIIFRPLRGPASGEGQRVPARRQKIIRGRWPADVLREFAALVDAGMPLLDALKALSRHHRGLARAMPDVIAGLQRGFQLGDVLLIGGAVSRQDAFLLNIAGQAGRLQEALRELADRHEKQHARQRRLVTRLYLSRLVSVLLVGIGIVIGIAGGLGAGAALAKGFLQLLLVFVVIGLLEKAASLDAATWLTWAWRLKLVGRMRRLQGIFEHYFYTVVRWQLAAGLPAAEAVEQAREALDAELFRSRATTAAMDLRGGMSFHDAMLGNDLVFSADLDQVIHSGESAGRLEQSLAQYQELQAVHIDLYVDGLVDWLPRVAYLLALGIAANALTMHTPGGYLDAEAGSF